MIILTGFIAALAASFSFFAEFGLHHPPCSLCAIQRTLWLSILATAPLSIFFKTFAKRLILLLLTLNLCMAAYHTLVQFKIMEDRCKTDLQINDPDAYAEILKKGGLQGCSEKTWTIAKIPAPILNGVTCLFLLYFNWPRRP
jgi:disulfide bond formation protein DsbB